MKQAVSRTERKLYQSLEERKLDESQGYWLGQDNTDTLASQYFIGEVHRQDRSTNKKTAPGPPFSFAKYAANH